MKKASQMSFTKTPKLGLPSDFHAYSQTDKGWATRHLKDVNIHFCGKFHEPYFHLLVDILSCEQSGNFTRLENQLRVMPEISGIIIEGRDFIFAATNKIRSKPILFTHDNDNGHTYVSTCPKYLTSHVVGEICPESCSAIQMGGYTIGRRTIFKDLFQLCAGEYLYARTGRLHVSDYWRYCERPPKDISEEQSLKELRTVTLGIFEELRDQLDGAPILIPLSAGYDSRLVISALKMLGTKNIRSFSYGYSDGFEVSTARQLSSYLDLPWIELKPHSGMKTEFLRSEEFNSYLDYIDTFSNAPFLQDIHHLWELKQTQGIEEGTYIINGNTGDFISGNHIPGDFNEQTVDKDIIAYVVLKHFGLWDHQGSPPSFDKVTQQITNELASYTKQSPFLSAKHAFAKYENFEFMHRQTKFLISGQQAYDFLGLNWALPLWHNNYIDFWTKIPLNLKLHQRLYKQFLTSENWMGVWQNMPVNAKNIRPNWIIGPRLLAMAVFALRGKDPWHRFERKYFQYFMDLTGTYRRFNYAKVCSDNRGARNQLAFIAEEYLSSKGIPITFSKD